MSTSATPAATTSRAWATREAVLDNPNGKSMTTQTPVLVPAHSGWARGIAAGLIQTVRHPSCTPLPTSRWISSGVNSGLSTE